MRADSGTGPSPGLVPLGPRARAPSCSRHTWLPARGHTRGFAASVPRLILLLPRRAISSTLRSQHPSSSPISRHRHRSHPHTRTHTHTAHLRLLRSFWSSKQTRLGSTVTTFANPPLSCSRTAAQICPPCLCVNRDGFWARWPPSLPHAQGPGEQGRAQWYISASTLL